MPLEPRVIPQCVVFDLGGVLIDWNPRYLYRKLLDDEAAVEAFLTEVCTPDWNEAQDGGRSIAEATAQLAAIHPQHQALIRAYYDRWPEMLGGAIHETVELLERLAARGVPLHALTNWSAETFPHARERFGFLQRFRSIVVSGEERMRKPEPRFYELLLTREALDASHTLFIDDSLRNVEAARRVGMQAVHFASPAGLARTLQELGLL